MRLGRALHGAIAATRVAVLAGVAAVGRLAGGLRYRRQELLVVALLGGSVLAGFAIEAWHRQTPGPLDRLEAEPPRLAAFSRAPGPRSRGAPAPTRGGAAGRARHPEPRVEEESAPTPEQPLDLNAATARELARLPGIGPRLAARIVARRSQLGGGFAAVEELASVPGLGARKASLLEGIVRVAPGIPAPPTEPPTRDAPAAPAEAAELADGAAVEPGPAVAPTAEPP
jgi:competence ComEA-like helix-hairpin-helix protein